MKVKKILKFYYSADGLERVIDGLIMDRACNFGGDGKTDAEEICSLIEEKDELSLFWDYLDGIISDFSEEEKSALKIYADLRSALKGQPAEIYRRVQRAALKLTRRARRLEKYGRGLSLIDKYYGAVGGG